MATQKKSGLQPTKTILCSKEIEALLPKLKGVPFQLQPHDATDLLRIGIVFELPMKSPRMQDRRFRLIPAFAKRWIRSIYGIVVFFSEKIASNRTTSYYQLLEILWQSRRKARR